MCDPRGLFLLCFKPWYNELFQTVDTLSCSERGLQLTFILNPVVHCRCYDRLSLLILFQLFLHKQFVLPHFLSEFCDIVLDSQKFMRRKKQIQFQFLFQQNRFIHQYLLYFQIIQCPAVFSLSEKIQLLWHRSANLNLRKIPQSFDWGPFSHCHSVPVLPHCFETLWEDYQRVTSRLLLRKEQDEVKLVLPPSQESQQDRTIEEPRNIALLGQQEC